MIITAFPIESQVIQTESLPGGTVWIPRGSKILHLGVAYPTDLIAMFCLCEPPKDETYQRSQLQKLDFVVATVGSAVPDNYIFRGPVKSKDTQGNDALVFVFEKPISRLIVKEGRG